MRSKAMVGRAGWRARTSAKYCSAWRRLEPSSARWSALVAAASWARSPSISAGIWRTWSWMRLRLFRTMASRVMSFVITSTWP